MYLDNAATSFPRPECVHIAVAQAMRSMSSAGRAAHSVASAASAVLQQCRTAAARLLHAPAASHVVFTGNCTEGLNTVLLGLLQPGDHVLASTLDHNSVLRPLEFLTAQRGVHRHLVSFDPVTGLLDQDEFQRTLQRFPVRLTVINHASNVTGRLQDVAWLTATAQQHGSLVLLDAAQTAGHVECHMEQLGVDFLVTSGHKGLAGPQGTGLLCFRPESQLLVQPLKFGGTGTLSESLQQPLTCPEKFESGTQNVPGIAGLLAAVQLTLSESPGSRHAHLIELTRCLLNGLREIPAVRLLTPDVPEQLCGIVSFVMDGMDSSDVAMVLDQTFDIQCRAGLHCAPLAHETLGTLSSGGAVRFSPGPWSTMEDMQTAIEAIDAIAQELH